MWLPGPEQVKQTLIILQLQYQEATADSEDVEYEYEQATEATEASELDQSG